MDGILAMLRIVMKEAYKSEYDLFACRLCLEIIIRF